MPQPHSLPLSGIAVADFSELLPGPFLTQNLLELGATVTKIERPPHGDNARLLYPGVFDSVNRGKQCVMLDLKQPAGAQAARDIIAACDVLVEGFRPGVMARLGLGYDAAAAINPRLVYVSLSGYGQNGPHAQRPGHDINYLATAGALALSGSDPGMPAPGAGLPVADLCGAMYALSSTLAALMQRQHTGRGQHLDVSLTDCVAHWMNPRLGQFSSAGLGSLAAQRLDVLNKPAYGVFRTRDDACVAIAALEDHFWLRLLQVLALDLDHAQTATYHQRVMLAAAINQAIAGRMADLDARDAIARLEASDVPVSLVEEPLALRGTPHAQARGLFESHAEAQYVRYPVRLTHMNEA